MDTRKIEIELKAIQELPVEEFERRFNELYDPANDDEKAEIMRLFKKNMNESILEMRAFIKETSLKMRLDNMLEIIPLSYIARVYFGKSKQWLYQRVNGYTINGKQAKFTDDQLYTFNNALKDIGQKIGSIELV